MAKKKRIKISGIYKITCIKNNVVYIGQSKDIADRWSDHKKELRGQYHKNNHLQRAWNKYGEDCFEFKILEECDLECLDKKEIFWIEELDTFKNGFNQSGGGNFGRVVSDETKIKLSESHKGKKLKEETIAKIVEKTKKKVFSFIIETGEITNHFDSCIDASSYHKVDDANITKCCNGNQISCMGYGWARLESLEKLEEILHNLRQTYICRVDEENGNIIKFYKNATLASNDFENGTIHKIHCHIRNKTIWNNSYWMKYSKYNKWKEEKSIGY